MLHKHRAILVHVTLAGRTLREVMLAVGGSAAHHLIRPSLKEVIAGIPLHLALLNKLLRDQ